MKSIVFKFWMVNILISIVLFVTFRIVIATTDHPDGNFFEWILQILDILLNLAYSVAYLIIMACCSLTIFLNLVDKIRNHFYLSLLTFIGIPFFCVVFLIVNILNDGLLDQDSVTIFRNLLIFSVIYLCLTTLEFFWFRRRISKSE